MICEIRKTPPIVLAAFGASSAAAREVYCDVESRVREAFPGHDVGWAYLSRRIVQSQRKLGIVLPTLEEALESLKAAGQVQVVVQPLLVVPGEEYASVKATECDGITLSIGDALLSSERDMRAAVQAIAPFVQTDIPNVLVCHGNKKHKEYNVPLLRLKQIVEETFENLTVASVEGEPGVEPLVRVREMAAPHNAVAFIPFMVVAGEHIMNDVMGGKPDSWRNIVGVEQASCACPLGSNPAIIEIFVQHIKAAIEGGHGATHDAPQPRPNEESSND